MCGIYGVEVSNGKYEAWSHVFEVLSEMRYRGPDALTVHRSGRMMLGFNRLSIVDRASFAAKQPHYDSHDRTTLFNGEIYNYRQLDSSARSEIELISSMIDARADLRQYLEGDYAIVSSEPSTGRLLLYRDRFGICPLYYQLKPFVAVSSEARRLYHPKEVPAHGRVIIDIKKRTAKVDVMRLYGATNDVNYSSSAPMVADLLVAAVLSRYEHSEVPVGVALSGGLDSSLVTLALARAGARAREHITTCFSEDSDDLRYARVLADKLGLPLTVKRINIHSEEVRTDTPKIIEHLDNAPHKITPLCYRTALRSWYVASYAKSRVILCGDGPDELLGGYPSHPAVLQRFPPEQKWRINHKRYDTLRSMQHFNNDRTNKMGMAHSKEFRSPFLASTLSQVLLAQPWQQGKQILRDVCAHLGMPREIYERPSKYSPDEEAVTSIPV